MRKPVCIPLGSMTFILDSVPNVFKGDGDGKSHFGGMRRKLYSGMETLVFTVCHQETKLFLTLSLLTCEMGMAICLVTLPRWT